MGERDVASPFGGKLGGAPAMGFEELSGEHRATLVRQARARGANDPEQLADLALLDGYRALDQLHDTDPEVVRAYLLDAVSNHVRRERTRLREEPVAAVMDRPSDPFEDLVVGALQLDEMLAQLPPDQRDVLRLRFVEDLTSDEVGRRLGKTDGAVRQLQLRGIRRLRRTVFAFVVLAVAVVGSLVLASRDDSTSRIEQAPADRSSLPGRPTVPSEAERLSQVDESDDARPVEPEPARDPASERALLTATTMTSAASDVATVPSSTAGLSAPAAPEVVSGIATAPGAKVYDGLNVPTALGSLAGRAAADVFAVGSTWMVRAGVATVESDPVGLSYTDDAGAVLTTTPGAIRVSDADSSAQISRPLASGPPAGEIYWVSFLLRLDSPAAGDAFWTPDGVHDVGAAGLQQHPFVRFVNRQPSSVPVVPGATTFLVLELRPEGASLWIDPDLTAPGPPSVVVNERPSPFDGTLRFKFNELGDGVYTIDEVRLGVDFEQVAPID